MSIKRVMEFTRFNRFYAKYKPLTPYGTDHKGKCRFISDKKELEHIYSVTGKMIELIHSDEHTALKIEHHLSRIDRLNSFDKAAFDSADLFLVKKFLIHCKSIASYFNGEWKKYIDFDFSSRHLLEQLTPDNDLSESFYLSSAFDEALGSVRKKINALNSQLADIKQKTINFLFVQYQLDFSCREFILVENSKMDNLNATHLVKEFYDSNMLRVKPVFPNDYMNGLIQKEELLNLEAEIEKKVLKRLSDDVNKEKHRLEHYIKAVEQIDVYIAKARTAIKYRLTKPLLAGKTIAVENGVFLPLKLKHDEEGLSYKPLTASFDRNSILLSGSNMGGKTILFKTIGFLQLLSQTGFFVPAGHFETRLFDQIDVLGVAQMQNIEGLSSFGQEIHHLSSAMGKPCSILLLVDELAKTTNAAEAKAILCAVLKHVAENKNITGFFSTHFINIPKIKGVSKYRMKGLNKNEYLNYCRQNTEHDIKEKIKLINSFMQYEVEEDNEKPKQYDALTIAGLLGLNSEILKYANEYLQTKHD